MPEVVRWSFSPCAVRGLAYSVTGGAELSLHEVRALDRWKTIGDPMRDPMRDTMRDPMRDPMRDQMRDPMRDPMRDTMRYPASLANDPGLPCELTAPLRPDRLAAPTALGR